jgi:malate dehydrogenase (oxaloacetate-decarboxylating)(NADP+)
MVDFCALTNECCLPVREISAHIAKEVIRTSQSAGVDRSTELRDMNDEDLLAFVHKKMWNP